MRISSEKLNIILAKQCRPITALRKHVSPLSLTKARNGSDLQPQTVGKIAKALGVDVEAILEEK